LILQDSAGGETSFREICHTEAERTAPSAPVDADQEERVAS
jgi:hypothetical protein